MPIESWISLWKVVLIVGVGLFATLAVAVTIGGAFDVCRLFRTLKEQHVQQLNPDAGRDSLQVLGPNVQVSEDHPDGPQGTR